MKKTHIDYLYEEMVQPYIFSIVSLLISWCMPVGSLAYDQFFIIAAAFALRGVYVDAMLMSEICPEDFI